MKLLEFEITGMSCKGCETKVEEALRTLPEIGKLSLDAKSGKARIEADTEISLERLRGALKDSSLPYEIFPSGHRKTSCCGTKSIRPVNGNGIFYCPMRCEGEKTYPKFGSCPVCGMDLVEQPRLEKELRFICPAHPEVVQDRPGECPECGGPLLAEEPGESEEDGAYRALRGKLLFSLVFAVPVFIISMSDMLTVNPLYALMDVRHWNGLQLLLTLPVVFYSCRVFFERAWQSVLSGNLNMFTLIGLGTGVAFVFSLAGLLAPGWFPAEFKTESGSVHLYFEATVVILTLALLGQVMEAKAHRQTGGALRALLNLAPAQATLVENGGESVISVREIRAGHLLRVKPGEKIPVDGRLSEGLGFIDESMITGESIPVEKKAGDALMAGTLNGKTSFLMEAQKVGAETLLSQIIQRVNEAGRSRAPIQNLADRFSGFFVPAVLSLSVLTFVAWYFSGVESAAAYGLANAVAVLIIACPCALGLATPMSVMVGVGKGAASGVLIKNAEALEKMEKVDVLITDKTGTVTLGKPRLEKIVATAGKDENQLLSWSASLSRYSEHPLAGAIVDFSKERKIPLAEAGNFQAIAGKGVMGTLDGNGVFLGNAKMMEDAKAVLEEEVRQQAGREQSKGKTVSFIAADGKVQGFVVISDPVKKTAKRAFSDLLAQGVRIVMMTGDNPRTARAVADELALSDFEAECLPEDKLTKIKSLQNEGKTVAMAGDGINDSPALTQADVGIAMGTGTDIAMQSSGITLVKGDLEGILKSRKLSRAALNNIRQNLFFAFVYNLLGIPVAAGVLYPFFGILLSPMLAAAAMSLSSVSVIANSLRLGKIKL